MIYAPVFFKTNLQVSTPSKRNNFKVKRGSINNDVTTVGMNQDELQEIKVFGHFG